MGCISRQLGLVSFLSFHFSSAFTFFLYYMRAWVQGYICGRSSIAVDISHADHLVSLFSYLSGSSTPSTASRLDRIPNLLAVLDTGARRPTDATGNILAKRRPEVIIDRGRHGRAKQSYTRHRGRRPFTPRARHLHLFFLQNLPQRLFRALLSYLRLLMPYSRAHSQPLRAWNRVSRRQRPPRTVCPRSQHLRRS
jgi:hypothetical protein